MTGQDDVAPGDVVPWFSARPRTLGSGRQAHDYLSRRRIRGRDSMMMIRSEPG